jgi:hypothetical protein
MVVPEVVGEQAVGFQVICTGPYPGNVVKKENLFVIEFVVFGSKRVSVLALGTLGGIVM